MENIHVRPVKPNEQFHVDARKDLIKDLDPYGLYFLEPDVDALQKLAENSGSNPSDISCTYLDSVSARYLHSVKTVKVILESLREKAFNFKLNDSLYVVVDKIASVPTKKKLKKRWTRHIKIDALDALLDGNDSLLIVKPNHETFAALEKMKNELCETSIEDAEYFIDHVDELHSYVTEAFLNILCTRYDPHSAYFSVAYNERFKESLSSESLKFGIIFSQAETGGLKIDQLVPGGAAWKTSEIHQGDILEAIKLENGDKIEIKLLDFQDALARISAIGPEVVTLYLKQVNGSKAKVKLRKESIEHEQNLIKSFVLRTDSNKVGYLALPGFYTKWEGESGSGCANDIAKELIKLKKEDIEGLILDLRYNSGGSMVEAIDLAGIFIDVGPLCVQVNREGKASSIKDFNRGTIFNKPMVILINRYSASASEILATALRDYNRAVIVGQTSFGKSTGQNVVPLLPNLNLDVLNPDPEDILGYLKITTSIFYDIFGGSYQGKGVEPDICLPDIYDQTATHESDYPHSLKADSISKKLYYTLLPPLPIEKLKENSDNRINSSPSFNQISKLSKDSTWLQPSTYFPVRLSSYRTQLLKEQAFEEEIIQSELATEPIYITNNLEYNQDLLSIDNYLREKNTRHIENITKDIYIQEGFNILTDLINLK